MCFLEESFFQLAICYKKLPFFRSSKASSLKLAIRRKYFITLLVEYVFIVLFLYDQIKMYSGPYQTSEIQVFVNVADK